MKAMVLTEWGFSAASIEVQPGKSIRIHGTYKNTAKGPQDFDRTFVVGDTVEVDSYNLTYTGKIVRITPKRVFIRQYPSDTTLTSLDHNEFTWRNWDFSEAEAEKRNSEWLD